MLALNLFTNTTLDGANVHKKNANKFPRQDENYDFNVNTPRAKLTGVRSVQKNIIFFFHPLPISTSPLFVYCFILFTPFEIGVESIVQHKFSLSLSESKTFPPASIIISVFNC